MSILLKFRKSIFKLRKNINWYNGKMENVTRFLSDS